MSESGLSLEVSSALNLTLKGTVGSFAVGSGDSQKSLDVKYLLTHVSLDFSGGNDEDLLKQLSPVREIFDPKDLDFDEIMQRDIDDSRVSNELIPYILDNRTKDLIKFFPPIVVIVLPISDNRNKPEPYYPKVTINEIEEYKPNADNWLVTRSGAVGSEVFEFSQPVVQGKTLDHDLVSLSLNTSKSRMIIVDGQHRAMSLLALYRNIKGEWSDSKKKPFEKYYEEWTPDYIRGFDLKKINLPLIVCTMPDLDKDFDGDYNLKKAARSIFLTLNKTARKVSRTRNLLLNDNDLISTFMRKTLSVIKDADNRSSGALSIQNIELDQDRQKISTSIAISGVSHLHYIIEHLLLDNGSEFVGISAQPGRFGSRTYFKDALKRLDCKNLLGDDRCSKTTRDSFSDNIEKKLRDKYQEIYGDLIIKFLNDFKPYSAHNKATLWLKEELNSTSDVDLTSMMFEGQGLINVFNEHRKNLKKKLTDGVFPNDVPRIEIIVNNLDNTGARLSIRINELHQNRCKRYLEACSDKAKFKNNDGNIDEKISAEINKIYDNIFKTIAFQTAVICGFFKVFENVSKRFNGSSSIDLDEAFSEYLEQLNKFFLPKSFSSFKSILSVLAGKAEGDDASNLNIVSNSKDSFKAIVIPGEMNPDSWPKYRYLFLEIWKPSDNDLLDEVNKELSLCRNQVFKEIYERRKKLVAQEKNITEDYLAVEDHELIFDESYGRYKSFLSYLGRSSDISSPGEFKGYINNPESEK